MYTPYSVPDKQDDRWQNEMNKNGVHDDQCTKTVLTLPT